MEKNKKVIKLVKKRHVESETPVEEEKIDVRKELLTEELVILREAAKRDIISDHLIKTDTGFSSLENEISEGEDIQSTFDKIKDIFPNINLDTFEIYWYNYKILGGGIDSDKLLADIKDVSPDTKLTTSDIIEEKWKLIEEDEQRIKDREKNRLAILEKEYETLLELGNISHSDFKIANSSLMIRVRRKAIQFQTNTESKSLTDDEAIEIFDNITVDEELPFVLLQSSENKEKQLMRKKEAKDRSLKLTQNISNKELKRRLFKVINTSVINESWISNERSSSESDKKLGIKRKPSTIYMKILGLAEIPKVLEYSKKKREKRSIIVRDYKDVVYEYSSPFQIIRVDVPRVTTSGSDYYNNKKIIIDRLMSRMRLMEAIQIFETKIQGHFIIPNADIEFNTFVDFILVDPIFSQYFYIDEKTGSFPRLDKTVMHFTFKSKYPVRTFNTTNQKDIRLEDLKVRGKKEDVTFKIEQRIATKANQEYTMKEGSPYLHLDITRGYSLELVNTFIIYICLLVKSYSKSRKALISLYTDYIPEFKQENIKRLAEEKLEEEEEDLLLSLYDEIPELKEIPVYDKICKTQPLVVEDSDAKNYKAMSRLNYFYKDEDDQVVTRVLVCTDEDNKYAGLRRNEDKDTKDRIPFLPCCFDSAQKKTQVYGEFKERMKEEIKEQKRRNKANKGKKNTKSQSFKVLDEGNRGELPKHIEAFLQLAIDNEGWEALGVINSASSLLHCILTVLDSKYERLSTQKKKDKVNKIRREIKESMINIAAQETYDMQPSEVLAALRDENVFLDGLKYYRILEDMYKCNIIMFTRSAEVKINALVSQGQIDIPRSKEIHYYYPAYPDGPVILVFKQIGSKTGAIRYPVYELIVNVSKESKRNVETQSQFTFEEMSKIYSGLNSGTRALSISPDITRFINGELPDIRTIFNIKDITGQYLDAYGKVRILRYKNFDIILTLPTIPLAVPIIDKYDKADNTYDDTLDMIKETRNEFKSNQYNTTGNLILGVWFFNAKHKLTFFTRCIPEEEKKSAEEKNNLRVPVISLNNMSALQSLQSARRNTFFLLQFIKYLFGLYVNRTSGDVSAANFINEYTVVNPEAVYDSKSITQWLPNTPKLGSALKELTSSYPGFFSERKLVLKSEALKEKLIKHLQKLEKEYEGINVNVINKMDNYYKNVTDFHTGVDVFVFLDEPSITRWLRQKIIAEYPLEIYNNVREFVYEPYIFIYGTKKYIIQNVKDGSKERATKCAENWLRLKINTGFRTVIRNVQLQATIWTTIPNFMIEEAANTGIEIVKFLERVKGEEEEDVDDEDIEGEDIENKVRYAAMLPLE